MTWYIRLIECICRKIIGEGTQYMDKDSELVTSSNDKKLCACGNCNDSTPNQGTLRHICLLMTIGIITFVVGMVAGHIQHVYEPRDIPAVTTTQTPEYVKLTTEVSQLDSTVGIVFSNVCVVFSNMHDRMVSMNSRILRLENNNNAQVILMKDIYQTLSNHTWRISQNTNTLTKRR